MPASSGTLVLNIAGVRVAVVAGGHDGTTLAGLLAPIVVETSANEADCSVDVDATGLEEIVGAALRAAIEHSADLLVHAGAVAQGGRAVLFPGASGVGKSTMIAACLRHGFDYLTDEAVALDLASGQVTGLSRPLMLTSWSVRALGLESTGEQARADVPAGKWAVTAEDLGARTVGEPLAVSHIVAMRRGGGSTKLEPMTTGQTLTQLLAASFNHYRHGAAAWEVATRVAREAQGWHLDVSDLDGAVAAVAELDVS